MSEAAATDDTESGAAGDLLDDVSFEATPQQILAPHADTRLLAKGSRVYVPFLPGAAFGETAAACRALHEQGLHAIPHLPARKLNSKSEAAERLDELKAAGCESLFLVGGDCASAAGPFASTLDLLESGVVIDQGFRRLGVAGHPEAHPVAGGQELADALRGKRDYALATGSDLWVVTQFVLQPAYFIQWLETHGHLIDSMRVYFGFPGPCNLATLLKYARLCGAGTSLRMAGKKPSVLALAGTWHPGGMVDAVRRYRATEGAGQPQGCHLFPFGGLNRSLAWLEKLRASSRDNSIQ